MPRGRKNKSLDEKIQDTQQSIYNLEVRTQELYEELEELQKQKKKEELEKMRQIVSDFRKMTRKISPELSERE